jgi:integrase
VVVDPIQYRAHGSEVLDEVLARPLEPLEQIVVKSDVRAAETVDALLGIPHQEQFPRCEADGTPIFALYVHSLDATVEVPPADLIRHGPDRATPYLYSEGEIRGLLVAAGELRPRLRAATYQTLIGLLATCGLRVSEAIALDTTDLDRDDDLLVIRETKFANSRLVPLHSTTTARLTAYIGARVRGPPGAAAADVDHIRARVWPRTNNALAVHVPRPPFVASSKQRRQSRSLVGHTRGVR